MAFKPGKKEDTKGTGSIDYFDNNSQGMEAGSLIGKGMKVKGNFSSDENVIIEGNAEGNIKVSKTLTIGKNGDVTADIDANTVRILGFAKGNIIAANRVEILSEGRYYGNIKSEILVVKEGAILIGDVNKDGENKEENEK